MSVYLIILHGGLGGIILSWGMLVLVTDVIESEDETSAEISLEAWGVITEVFN